jgi:hypothetical protein
MIIHGAQRVLPSLADKKTCFFGKCANMAFKIMKTQEIRLGPRV